MSPLGKVSSQALISSISMICEAFIYVYLGVSIWELKKTEHTKGNEFSWTFTLIETGICFFSRAMMLIILGSITILIRGKSKWRLSFSEVSIIWFAGLIRGSVAFALIQELESPNEE
jgi:sodium/hydrogen exchanger-like protein 6/7/sodium/hydrogen exchanger 8